MLQRKDQVVSKTIWREIYDATTNKVASLSRNSTETLKKYCEHSRHRDIVYRHLIQRAERSIGVDYDVSHSTPSTNSTNVLTVLRVLSILRHYLPQYLPSYSTMIQLVHFCGKYMHHQWVENHPNLRKSFWYLDKMVSRLSQEILHASIDNRSETTPDNKASDHDNDSSKKTLEDSETRIVVVGDQLYQHDQNEDPKKKPESPVNLKIQVLEDAIIHTDQEKERDNKEKDKDKEYKGKVLSRRVSSSGKEKHLKRGRSTEAFVRNFLAIRPPPKKMPKKESAASLLATVTFGGQFHSQLNGVTAGTLYRACGIVIYLCCYVANNNPDTESVKNYMGSTTRRLSGNAVVADKLLQSLVYLNPRIQEHIETVAMSKKREEKTLLHSQRSEEQLFQYKYYNEQQPLQLTPEQIDRVANAVLSPVIDPETRMLATKVLIKLLLDIYIRDGVAAGDIILSLLLEMLSCNELKVHAFNLLFNLNVHVNLLENWLVDDNDGAKPEIHERLFGYLKEMLLWLLHSHERNAKVWETALHCLLHFVVQGGKIDKQKLLGVDIRVIRAMLKNVELEDDTHNLLIKMLVNMLYINSKTLDINVLNECGIDFIIHQYTKIRSTEGKENLFAVIFDYIIRNNERLNEANNKEQLATLLELLKWFEAPQYLCQIFKMVPEKFVRKLVEFIQQFFDHLSSKLDKPLIVVVLWEFEKLAVRHNKLAPEFEHYLQLMLHESGTDYSDQDLYLEILLALLHAEQESDRKHGELWIVELLKVSMEEPLAFKVFVEDIFTSLAQSSNGHVRYTYVSIVEKVILAMKAKFQSHGNEAQLQSMFEFLNKSFLHLIDHGERDRTNLMFMLDVMFNLVSITHNCGPNSEGGEFSTCTCYTSFLKGDIVVSIDLLKMLDIQLLQHLFVHISGSKAAKVVVLQLIIEKCIESKDDLEVLGGMNFFQRVLRSQDPQLAYIAGCFIIDQFEEEDPKEYTAVLSKLLIKAQEEDNESIISNNYLQIKAILEMTKDVP